MNGKAWRENWFTTLARHCQLIPLAEHWNFAKLSINVKLKICFQQGINSENLTEKILCFS